MGTRHLILVQLENEYKVAQYGQWDGYPTGTGREIVKILKEIDLEKFKSKLLSHTFLVPSEMAFNEDIEKLDYEKFKVEYPELSRDSSENILKLIYDTEKELILADNSDFANDSLFCEWAYVLNLDTNKLEIYKGFNKDKSKVNYRFNSQVSDSMGYCAVSFLAEIELSKLSEQFMIRLEESTNKE